MPRKKKIKVDAENRPNILTVKKEERSSRFVIDLAVSSEPQETIRKESFCFSEAMDNIAEFDAKKRIIEPLRSKMNFRKEKDGLKIPKPELKISLNESFDKIFKILEPLAFFFLFKIIALLLIKIANFLYKICFWLGWSVVFVFRFAFIILNKIIKKIRFIALGSLMVTKNAFSVILKPAFAIFPAAKQLPEQITKSFKSNNDYDLEFEKIIETKKFGFKPVGFFILFSIILIIPFKALTYYKSLDLESVKGKVLGASETAINNLKSASESASDLNFFEAKNNFSEAGRSFLEAQEQLSAFNNIFFDILSLAPSGKVKLAAESKKILAAGEISSRLGESLSLAMDSLFKNPDEPLMNKLENLSIFGFRAEGEAKELQKILSEIDEDAFPDEYRNQFVDVNKKVKILTVGLSNFSEAIDHLKSFLGQSENKRYLLVFQNNAEMRASGGFIGSYALVDFSNGEIKNIEAPSGGSYDTEGGMKELVTAPQPLSLVNPLWHFWDANWWPDWPTTAKKLMWFYEKSDGPTVDGVISLTPDVMEKLLEVIGPIDMSAEYGVIINKENFWAETQAIAEHKLTPEEVKAGVKHEPKKIIGDLMDKIISELPKKMSKDNLTKLLEVVDSSLNEKQILFYFTDKKLEKEISARGWGGEIINSEKDYLMVVNTNIAGGKSDKKITESVYLKTEFMSDGSIVNELKIERRHDGIKNEPFTGVRNVDWMRIYVPEGSELISSEGWNKPDDIYFTEPEKTWKKDDQVLAEESLARTDEQSGTKIYEENGKSVFANWSMVDPGETATILLRYKLPFSFNQHVESDRGLLKKILKPWKKELYSYSLLTQKQPGAKSDKINIEWIIPDSFEPNWKYPDNLEITEKGLIISSELNKDKYWGMVLEKLKE